MTSSSARGRRTSRKTANAMVRRSVAIPARILDEAIAAAGSEVGANVNQVIRLALEAFVEERRRAAFAEEMSAMAADTEIRRASDELDREFRVAEMDGLGS